MRQPFLALVLACSLAASGCSSLLQGASAPRRAIVVSFDGAGERVVERMLERGVMPNLAALRARGVSADYSRTNYPSKTAAGHASLWTGAFSDVHGITSNKVLKLPLSAHTATEVTSGFEADVLLAEPFFVTAAKAGKRVIVNQATHTGPFDVYAPGGRFGGPFHGSLTLLDGMSGERGEEGVLNDATRFAPSAPAAPQRPRSAGPVREARFHIGESDVLAYAYDDPRDPVQGFDTLRLVPPVGEAQVLKPAGPAPDAAQAQGWSAPVTLQTAKGPARSYFRLYALAPDLSAFILYHTGLNAMLTNKAEAAERYYADPFIRGGAIRAWGHGAFGKTMYEGGDGLAEARYLDTVQWYFERAARRLERLKADSAAWDLLVQYVPLPDEAEHAWYGTVDDNAPTYDPALAPRVWSQLERLFGLVDGYIGALSAAAGSDTVLTVTSDHGMAGIKWKFFPNVALKQAGLLVTNERGEIDWSRTQVLYPPADGGFLVVNRKTRKGGIVEEAQVPGVLAAARRALALAKGQDGQPIVTSFLTPGPETADLGIGGPRGGDLYMDVRPGYFYIPDWQGKALLEPFGPGNASHVYDPRRPDMHAIMYMAGPGLKAGAQIGAVRNNDMAPTVCRLLGIPAPAQATGRVLSEALTGD